jgi:hypothetical protein
MFLVNEDSQVAFVQMPPHSEVIGFRVDSRGGCIVELRAGGDETLDNEQVSIVLDFLRHSEAILVVHLDENSVAVVQYSVPVHLMSE